MSKAKRQNFYSKKKWEEVNQENKYILDDYVLELRSQGKTKGTIYQYTRDIKAFMCWGVDNAQNKSILEMNRRDFRRYFLVYQEAGTSANRMNRIQSSLRRILEFCYRDEELYEYDRNVMDTFDGFERVPVKEIVFLTDDEVEKLINHYIEQGELQKALYFSLSYDSAARRNEIHQVEKHSFYDEELNTTNEVVGKGKKVFELFYFDRTKQIARRYLEERGEDDIDSLWVVEDGDGERRERSYESLYYWVSNARDDLEKITKERKEFTPHSFRHSALENYENGTHYNLQEFGRDSLSLEALKTLANHNSIETTQSYLKDRDQERLFEELGLE